MAKAIKIEESNIKCDHCGYKSPRIIPRQAKRYINKPCPVCGHNLLTRREYLGAIGFLFIVDIVNLLFKADENTYCKKVVVTSDKSGLSIKDVD